MTPVETAVLQALARYHYLSASQVCRLLYSRGSLTYVQTRLKKLTEAGSIQRLWLPRASQSGSAPSVYRLAAKGIKHLQHLGLDVSHRYRPSDHMHHSYLFLNHTLCLNDFLIGVELFSMSQNEVSLAGLVHEQVLKRRPVHAEVDGRRLAVVPDAWLDFRLRPGYQVCLAVELDMGTEEQKKWRRKVRALLAFANGPYQEAFHTTSLTIAIVVTTGEKRLFELVRWTEAELHSLGEEQNASLFLFLACSPADAVAEDILFRPCWYQPLSPDAVALFAGAD